MLFHRNRLEALEQFFCLQEEEAFVELLEHERLRSERSTRSFCLLHITAPTDARLLAVAERISHRKLRGADAAGGFRQGIGVMLPETELVGAENVRHDLGANLGVNCTTYVFPSDPLDLEQFDKPDRGRREDPLPLEELMTIHDSLPKRAVDIVGSTAGLVLLSPVLLLAMLLIKITSEGPVLFKQVRAGRSGKPFTIYKLRTMVINAERMQHKLRAMSEQDGPAFKLRRDPRVTWIGRILRKSCIDELPQLWNVLLGQMSLVGPRPLPLQEAAQVTPWARARLRVKPGLTCIWQVEGGPDVKFVDWMRMDLRYIQTRTLRQDLKLILLTAKHVLLHRAST